MKNTTIRGPRRYMRGPGAARSDDCRAAAELARAERKLAAQTLCCSYVEACARVACFAFAAQMRPGGAPDIEAFAACRAECERSRAVAAEERRNLEAAHARLEAARAAVERVERAERARTSTATERASYARARTRTAECERVVALLRDRVRRSGWTLASSPPPPVAVVDSLANRSTRDHDAAFQRRPHAEVGVSANYLPKQPTNEPRDVRSGRRDPHADPDSLAFESFAAVSGDR